MCDSAARKEIEITPEMTEAGTMELAKWDYVMESDEDAVARIFRAMAARSVARRVE